MKISVEMMRESVSKRPKKRFFARLYWSEEDIFDILINNFRVKRHFFGNRIQPIVTPIIENAHAISGGIHSQ
jgi:hypothetical protein